MSEARHPGCRIGSVTHKASGFRVVRLHDGPERTRRAIMAETREMIDHMDADGRPVVGFVMVMWDATGGSDAACRAYSEHPLDRVA